MVRKKTWVKPKNKVLFCGYCEVCNKQLYSDTPGWIVNAEKKSFCHNGIDELCFDTYLNR